MFSNVWKNAKPVKADKLKKKIVAKPKSEKQPEPKSADMSPLFGDKKGELK